MANPQAKVNLEKFVAFLKERNKAGDWEDYILPNQLDLNKKMIARECDFDRKRITGNSKIFKEYQAVKLDLVAKGILLEDTRANTEKATHKTRSVNPKVETNSLSVTHVRNTSLEQELLDTKQKLEKANLRLKQLEAIENHMIATGRL
ncbi:hypothetical protein ACPV5R_11135 [Vibrio astriarenae]